MRSKLLIAAGLVVAFVLGTVSSGLLSGTTSAFQKPEPTVAAPQSEAPVVSSLALSTAASPRQIAPARYASPRAVAVSNPVRTSTARKRSLKNEALIVGGGAGAGAAIGAVAGGGKGAAIGALSGGAAGLVYDLLTRNKS